jgi:hypothetical protein
MAISNQELSELKSRVLTAIRTGTNIARVSDYLIGLIREAGSYLPERPKSDTDTEYLYSVILAIESKRENQESPKVQFTEVTEPAIVEEMAPVIPEPIEVTEPEEVVVSSEPIELEETPVELEETPVELEETPVAPEPIEESAPEITTVEELDSAEVDPTDNKEAEESVPEHPEVQKPKGGKQSKKSKK